MDLESKERIELDLITQIEQIKDEYLGTRLNFVRLLRERKGKKHLPIYFRFFLDVLLHRSNELQLEWESMNQCVIQRTQLQKEFKKVSGQETELGNDIV